MTNSLKHDKWKGMLVFSGLQGFGKSTLAFTADDPELMGILDFDLKGEQMAKEYGIKNFWQPTAFMKPDMDPTEYDREKIATWTVEKLLALPEGTTTLVIDNTTAVEAGLGYLVEKNPTKYGLNAENVKAGRYGGVNPGISILWSNLVAYLKNQKGVELIIMVNHMTQPWADGKPVPNRFHVKGNKIFRNLSVGTFILVPGDPKRGGQPPLPAALVVKEALAVRTPAAEGQRPTTVRALPFRFPIADWPYMDTYFDKPANFQNPKPGETWNEFELNAYGEFLSAETLQWIRDAAKIRYSEEGQEGDETGTESKPETLGEGRARLLRELKPHYKDLTEVADGVKALNMTYSAKDHDEIKRKLLEKKGIKTEPKEQFQP